VVDNDYGRFLKEQIPNLKENIGNGEVIWDGSVVGQHNGYPFYTIGQRKGIGAFGEKLYVKEINPKTNKIFIGRDEDLLKKNLIATDANWISVPDVPDGMSIFAKVRYKDIAESGVVYQHSKEKFEVVFDNPKRAITPGQSVVLYDGEEVVGGGIIENAF
jgi:tRNA-specific 2-thiouridylase